MIRQPGNLVPAAKSVLNRLLLLQYYAQEDFKVIGDSHCADVNHLRQGLAQLANGQPVDCGDGATVFRFLALRASRIPGRHRLGGTARLLSRPHGEIADLLADLGVQVAFEADGSLAICSGGWREPKGPVRVDLSRSSQFASALLLNSWELSFPLTLAFTAKKVSQSYWSMTKALCRQAGMECITGDMLTIKAGQVVRPGTYRAEVDQGAAFALAAVAAVSGEVELPLPDPLQPDGVFPEILRAMAVPIRETAGAMVISAAPELKPIERDLGETPDLFPVLALLCALAPGSSRLYGAPQLVVKESNRIMRSAELIRSLGRKCVELPDGMEITGTTAPPTAEPITFDPDHDHRLAMAAGVAMAAGFPLHLSAPRVVDKSFPEFWRILGVTP